MSIFDPAIFDTAVFDAAAPPAVLYWDDPASWPELGHVPTSADDITPTTFPAGRTIVLRGAANVRSMHFDGTLLVRQGLTTSLTLHGGNAVGSRGNLIVGGTVNSEDGLPLALGGFFTVNLLNIQESRFVGGGMVPLDTDTGVWPVGTGRWMLEGFVRLPWARATGSLAVGATSAVLGAVPTGWQIGDEIVVVPTGLPSETNPSSWTRFEERTITGINGNTVSFGALTYAHPTAVVEGVTYGAEILNLTRNVVVQGQPGARAHWMMTTTVPQTLRHIVLRYMGPRQSPNPVLGRYGLHFHMMQDASRGSLVEGVVIRQSGARGLVPHRSHGVTMRQAVMYDIVDEAHWYDTTDSLGTVFTHDQVLDRCVAAKVARDPAASTSAAARNNGFWLGRGDGNQCLDCVGVGITGGGDSSGLHWPEGNANGVWLTQRPVLHNNDRGGLFVWQNHDLVHLVEDVVSYRNRVYGIGNGAYLQRYHYRNAKTFENGTTGVRQWATAPFPEQPSFLSDPVRYENCVFDELGAYGLTEPEHVSSALRALITGCRFRRSLTAGVGIADGAFPTQPSLVDVVNTVFDMNEFWLQSNCTAGAEIRVQTSTGPHLLVTDVFRLHKPTTPGQVNVGDDFFASYWNASVLRILCFISSF